MERENCKKIAFIGTSCTGKTALLEHYRKACGGSPNVAFVEEVARAFFQNNPTIDDRFSAETQGKVQALVLQNEQAAHDLGATVIFCDRSVIDAAAYVWANGDKKGAEELLRRIEFWLPTYHKFLLLNPVDIPYATDDIRQEDEETRQKFHDAFIELLTEKQIPYELLSGTVEERIRRIDEILSED